MSLTPLVRLYPRCPLGLQLATWGICAAFKHLIYHSLLRGISSFHYLHCFTAYGSQAQSDFGVLPQQLWLPRLLSL